MFRIYPYKQGSRSVRSLKESLDALTIKLENSRYTWNPGHVVINWGNSRLADWMRGEGGNHILNHPTNVGSAANKLNTLDILEDAGVPTVEFWTDKSKAEEWLSMGHKVFARHTLTGHSGEGIEVLEPDGNSKELIEISDRLLRLGLPEIASQLESFIDTQEVPDALMYTKGITNTGEYRVHVFKGEIILYQKKSRRVDDDGNVLTAEGAEADVRNLASNWVYRTGNLTRLERIEQLAIKAIEALGLDFGAVDIIKDQEGNVFVLEVNSAPGLGNRDTLEAYTNAFKSLNNNYVF